MTNTAPYCLARRHANHQRIQEVATLSTGNKQLRPWRSDLNEMASTKAGAIYSALNCRRESKTHSTF